MISVFSRRTYNKRESYENWIYLEEAFAVECRRIVDGEVAIAELVVIIVQKMTSAPAATAAVLMMSASSSVMVVVITRFTRFVCTHCNQLIRKC